MVGSQCGVIAALLLFDAANGFAVLLPMAFDQIKALPAKDSQLSLVRLASPVLVKGSPSATEQALRGVQMSCKGAAVRLIP